MGRTSLFRKQWLRCEGFEIRTLGFKAGSTTWLLTENKMSLSFLICKVVMKSLLSRLGEEVAIVNEVTGRAQSWLGLSTAHRHAVATVF